MIGCRCSLMPHHHTPDTVQVRHALGEVGVLKDRLRLLGLRRGFGLLAEHPQRQRIVFPGKAFRYARSEFVAMGNALLQERGGLGPLLFFDGDLAQPVRHDGHAAFITHFTHNLVIDTEVLCRIIQETPVQIKASKIPVCERQAGFVQELGLQCE